MPLRWAFRYIQLLVIFKLRISHDAVCVVANLALNEGKMFGIFETWIDQE
jgi:hypothetical protein